jgi:hypothetical protein
MPLLTALKAIKLFSHEIPTVPHIRTNQPGDPVPDHCLCKH